MGELYIKNAYLLILCPKSLLYSESQPLSLGGKFSGLKAEQKQIFLLKTLVNILGLKPRKIYYFLLLLFPPSHGTVQKYFELCHLFYQLTMGRDSINMSSFLASLEVQHSPSLGQPHTIQSAFHTLRFSNLWATACFCTPDFSMQLHATLYLQT